MRLVYLMKGVYAQVDDEDFWRVSQHRWYPQTNKCNTYAVGTIKREKVYLHRFIMGINDERKVDHRNRDSLDCQKSNLRIATSVQNGANRRIASNNTTGYKGVSWDADRGKFTARVQHQTKGSWFERFDTAEQAALAYNVKAKELHGEFAYQNKIGEDNGSQV